MAAWGGIAGVQYGRRQKDHIRDRSFFTREGGLVGFGGGGGGACEKNGFRRGDPKKLGKKGGHVKYFSNTLKWHKVLILKNCS